MIVRTLLVVLVGTVGAFTIHHVAFDNGEAEPVRGVVETADDADRSAVEPAMPGVPGVADTEAAKSGSTPLAASQHDRTARPPDGSGTPAQPLELINSPVLADRRHGYAMLTQSAGRNTPEVNDALIVASHYETDQGALIGLMASFSTLGTRNAVVKASARRRLQELTLHENPVVAAQALSSMSRMSQDADTLAVLKTHLYGTSERMQLAALNGLYYFQRPDDALVAEIDAIAGNAQVTVPVRNAAADVVQIMREVATLDAAGQR